MRVSEWLLRLLSLVVLSASAAVAVRIGVSRDDANNNNNNTTTTTTTTTTPITTITTTFESTTLGAETTSGDWSTIAAELNGSGATPTEFRDFNVPTLPTKPATTMATKKTKTFIKTTPKATTTTAATTTATTTNETLPTTASSTAAAAAAAATASAMNFYCACDLLAYACDLNCCCDAACGANALQVFDCQAAPAHPELRRRLEDYEYQHGLPSCQVNDGWLCVFRTNTANAAVQQQREQQRRQAAMHAHYDTARYYKWALGWPELTTLPLDTDGTRVAAGAGVGVEGDVNYYRYGDKLQMWHVQQRVQQSFELPAALGISPQCHIKRAVRHLHAERRVCWLPSLAAQQRQQSTLLALIGDMRLLPQPHMAFDEHAAAAPPHTQHTLEWQTQQCVHDNCKPLQLQSQSLAANGSAVEMNDFYATRIVLQLQHNYTHITAAALLLHADDGKTKADQQQQQQHQQQQWWQIYEIRFVLNESVGAVTPPATRYSGPLGYLQGEPIIVARMPPPPPPSAQSNATEQQTFWLLRYFDKANTTTTSAAQQRQQQYEMHLFSKRKGKCHKAPVASRSAAIAYGINAQKTCNMHLPQAEEAANNSSSSNNNNNYTHICAQLQQSAWALLIDAPPEQLVAPAGLFVSQFGKPQNRSDAWLPLQVLAADGSELHHDGVGGDVLPPVTSVYSERTQTFVCRNVLLSIAYEFQVATFALQRPQQQLVTHAALRLGTLLDLEFELQERVVVPLSVSVMFYDRAVSELAVAAGSRATTAVAVGNYIFTVMVMLSAYIYN